MMVIWLSDDACSRFTNQTRCARALETAALTFLPSAEEAGQRRQEAAQATAVEARTDAFAVRERKQKEKATPFESSHL